MKKMFVLFTLLAVVLGTGVLFISCPTSTTTTTTTGGGGIPTFVSIIDEDAFGTWKGTISVSGVNRDLTATITATTWSLNVQGYGEFDSGFFTSYNDSNKTANLYSNNTRKSVGTAALVIPKTTPLQATVTLNSNADYPGTYTCTKQ